MNTSLAEGSLKLNDRAGLLTAIGAACAFLFAIYDARATRIEEILSDHEIPITKREANPFTAQESNELKSNMTRLTVELAQQQDA